MRVVGTLSSQNPDRAARLDWQAFFRPDNTGESLKDWKPGYISSPPETIIVPNRQAVVQRIEFVAQKEFELSSGTYTLELVALTGSKLKEYPSRAS